VRVLLGGLTGSGVVHNIIIIIIIFAFEVSFLLSSRLTPFFVFIFISLFA
jgi:hypothetical protein